MPCSEFLPSWSKGFGGSCPSFIPKGWWDEYGQELGVQGWL